MKKRTKCNSYPVQPVLGGPDVVVLPLPLPSPSVRHQVVIQGVELVSWPGEDATAGDHLGSPAEVNPSIVLEERVHKPLLLYVSLCKGGRSNLAGVVFFFSLFFFVAPCVRISLNFGTFFLCVPLVCPNYCCAISFFRASNCRINFFFCRTILVNDFLRFGGQHTITRKRAGTFSQ